VFRVLGIAEVDLGICLSIAAFRCAEVALGGEAMVEIGLGLLALG
jgi:hypothetical protein